MLGVALAAAVLLLSCSSERVPPTLPGAHPEKWMDKRSGDFHGRVVLFAGTASCSHCHGVETSGGSTGIDCIDCHGPGTSACRECHGGLDNNSGAPPYGLRGESSTASPAVGAHTAHLDTTALGAPVACGACHVVPVFLLSQTHLDQTRPPGQPLDSIAEVVWHGFADGGGASWDRAAGTCSGAYCHGNFAGGSAANAPLWTGAGQADCGSCHDTGVDPGLLGWEHEYHVETAGLTCGDCHASVVDTLLNITNPLLHVNGRPDTLTRDPSLCRKCHGSGPDVCASCHGGLDNQTGAPPAGLRGETLTTQLAVGAHTAHVEGNSVTDGIACSDCHLVPSRPIEFGHFGADSIAEMTWSSLAGAASSWERGAAECSNTYCHGNFLGGNASNSPIWTAAGQAGCGSCHDAGGNPAFLSGRHWKHVEDENFDCIECHVSVVDRFLNVVNRSLMVNGRKDVSFLRGGTYQNGSCSGLPSAPCHGSEDWEDN